MATQRQYRRGTTAEHAAFTGVEAEATIDTDKKTWVVHDGATAGGFALAREDGSNVTAFRPGDGAEASPVFSFASSTDMGFWRQSDDELSVSVNGTEFSRWQGIGAGKAVYKVLAPNIQIESAEGGSTAQSYEFDDTTGTVATRKLAVRRVDGELQFRNITQSANVARWDMNAAANSFYMDANGDFSFGKASIDDGATTGAEFDTSLGRLFLTGTAPRVSLVDTDTSAVHHLNGSSSTGAFNLQIDHNADGSSPLLDISVAGTKRARVSPEGLSIGSGSPHSGSNVLAIFTGTAPTGSVADGIQLYSEDVSSSAELKVRDEAGNITTLSPHNFSLFEKGPSEPMAFSYYSERDGQAINVDMLAVVRAVEKLSGLELVKITTGEN